MAGFNFKRFWLGYQPPTGEDIANEVTWNTGIEYYLSRDFSLTASYDNRFGAGGGLAVRF
ncbi:hypothetical protein [Gelidibacter salicanalis]|uniref:Uncharacterized protein n=1 Tax=Gelidibacter salicanalis TaxID=291193 RepID=A0A934KPV3_9FLAO|nr:hypothetical protein [Gelidibacter salicanalis]MBJ7881644.1 hypothetical protein [Gelidibacter salicanalis]